MATDDSSEVLELKRKLESTETSLKKLKDLSHKAIADYEDLQRRYDQNQKQYDELKVRLQDTEYQLQSLQRALEPACEEFNQLQSLYSIENKCREQAEKYASTVVKQNKSLKRQSQMLLDQIGSTNLTMEAIEEISVAEDDEEAEEGRAKQLELKISQLESHIDSLNKRLEEMELERSKFAEKELTTSRQFDQYEDQLKESQNKISELERNITNYSTVADQAVEQYRTLEEKYETQRALRETAEQYASKMLGQHDAMVRQSTVLLENAASDHKLMGALLQIEDLQKELESLKESNKKKVAELEEIIETNSSTKHIEDLEKRLESATETIEEQQKQVKDLESWKVKLENDYKNIEQELEVARRPPPPPPPPLPPPPPVTLFTLFKPNRAKKTEEEKKAALGVPDNADFNKALEEMMARIKGGNTLKPRNERRPSLPGNKTSAMDELSDILSKRKAERSMSVDSGTPMPMSPSTNHSSDATDFERVFQKVRGGNTLPRNIPEQNLSRISEEKSGELSPTSPGSQTGKRSSANPSGLSKTKRDSNTKL